MSATVPVNDKSSSLDDEGYVLTPNNDYPPSLIRTVTVFTPEKFNNISKDGYNDEELTQLVMDNTLNQKLRARIFRAVLCLLLGILGVILVIFTSNNFHITKVIGIGVFVIINAYLFHLYYYVFNCEIAHRIYSLTDSVPGWIKMPITCRQIMYKYQPITSISEFSAIGGGTANQMLLCISLTAWVLILTQGLNNIWFEKIWLGYVNKLCGECKYSNVSVFRGFDQILMFIGTFGMLLIGIFDLDPFSSLLQSIHSTGVGLAILCPFGFLVQQINGKRPIGIGIALLLGIIVLISAMMWKCVYQKRSDKIGYKYSLNPPQTINDINIANKEVRSLTIKNVISESFVLLCGALSLTLWLLYFDNINNVFNNKDIHSPFGPFNEYFNYIINKYQCNPSKINSFDINSFQFC